MAQRTVRFIEPQGRPGRPFNAWIAQWPLLGPITLASILQERGYDVAVCNENVSGPVTDNAAMWADLCRADVVGITIMTATASRGYRLAEALRAAGSRTVIAFGGAHATFCPEEALAHGDVVVRGEGETVIERLASGEIRSGLVEAAPLEDLDAIPALNHRLMVDFHKLAGPIADRALYHLPVMASRGCPHGCTYCSVSRMFGRRVRRQSLEKVHDDLRRYREQGFRRVFFYDDNLTADRQWARRLLERIAPLGLRINAQVRVDFAWLDRQRTRIDTPLLEAFQRAGGNVLYIGYETVDDRTAAGWNKGYHGRGLLRDRLLEDTRILHEHGFWIHGMFVLGPDDTKSSADAIVRFARRGKLESMQISILTPLPGTPLYDQLRPHLVFNRYPFDWDFYDGTHCVYDNSRLGLTRFQQTVLQAHLKFYRWGGWSARRIRALLAGTESWRRKLQDLWQNARTARTTMKAWKQETLEFLALAQERMTPHPQR